MFPYPFSQVFAGRVLEALDVVEAIVIEAVEQRLESAPQISKIHHPACLLADRAADVNFDSE